MKIGERGDVEKQISMQRKMKEKEKEKETKGGREYSMFLLVTLSHSYTLTYLENSRIHLDIEEFSLGLG